MSRCGALMLTSMIVWLGLGTAHTSWGEPSNLKMDVLLDEHSYLVGEPIYSVIAVANLGQAAFEDLSSLNPGESWLELDLYSVDTGSRLAFTGNQIDAIYPWGGTLLPAGREVVLTTNLLLWFGTRAGEGFDLTRCLNTRVLPPGRYRLTVRFRARMRSHGEENDLVLKSSPTAFEIIPIQSSPAEEARVRQFVAGCPDPSDRPNINSYCYRSLSQFYGSRYFTLIYSSIGPAADIPLDSLLATLDRYDGNAVRRAWLINLRCKTDRMSPDEKLGRIRTLKKSQRDELSRRVLDYWEDRIKPFATHGPDPRPR